MRAGPRTAALVIALSLGAASATAGDYRVEIMDHVVEPCFLRLAGQQPAEGVSPEVMERFRKLLRSDALAKLVGQINGAMGGDPPAAARHQIYRVALRACIRRGAASLGLR